MEGLPAYWTDLLKVNQIRRQSKFKDLLKYTVFNHLMWYSAIVFQRFNSSMTFSNTITPSHHKLIVYGLNYKWILSRLKRRYSSRSHISLSDTCMPPFVMGNLNLDLINWFSVAFKEERRIKVSVSSLTCQNVLKIE